MTSALSRKSVRVPSQPRDKFNSWLSQRAVFLDFHKKIFRIKIVGFLVKVSVCVEVVQNGRNVRVCFLFFVCFFVPAANKLVLSRQGSPLQLELFTQTKTFKRESTITHK